MQSIVKVLFCVTFAVLRTKVFLYNKTFKNKKKHLKKLKSDKKYKRKNVRVLLEVRV